jgi:Protein of unknown function (DUF1566)
VRYAAGFQGVLSVGHVIKNTAMPAAMRGVPARLSRVAALLCVWFLLVAALAVAAAPVHQVTLVVRTDAACTLFVDTRQVTFLYAGDGQVVPVQAGEVLVECVTAGEWAAGEWPVPPQRYSEVFKLKTGEKRVVQIELAEKVAAGKRAMKERYEAEKEKRAQTAERVAGYVDAGPAIVRNEITGLEWTALDNGSYVSWDNADSYCAGKGEGWRLPSVKELRTLYDEKFDGLRVRCGNATCNVSRKFRLSGDQFWSNEIRGSANDGWTFMLSTGHPQGTALGEFGRGLALCVRRP